MTFFTAFWSYKGGVGRTTALATTAYILAKRGYRVLLWDLDLLAPTLERLPVFRDQAERSPGFVHVLDQAVRQKGELTADLEASFASAVCTIKLGGEQKRGQRSKEPEPTLWLLPARGYASEEVIKRVAVIAWEEEYRKELGFHVWETLKGIASTYRPGMGEKTMDMVLMDASAGYTMLGKVANIHLADHVMAFTRLTPLSIEESGKHVGWLKQQYKEVYRKPIYSSIVASPVPEGYAERRQERLRSCLIHFGQEPDATVDLHQELLLSDDIYTHDPPAEYRVIADRLVMVDGDIPVEQREQAAAAFAFSKSSSSSIFLELAGLRARSGFPASACRGGLQEGLLRMKERKLEEDAALVTALLSLSDSALLKVLPAFVPESTKPVKGRGHFDASAMAASITDVSMVNQGVYVRAERFLTALSHTNPGEAYQVYLDELQQSRSMDPWYWCARGAYDAGNLSITMSALRAAFTGRKELPMRRDNPYRPGMSFHAGAFIGRGDQIQSVYPAQGRYAFTGRPKSGRTWLLGMLQWLWSSEDDGAVEAKLSTYGGLRELSNEEVLGAGLINGRMLARAIEASQSTAPLIDELCTFLKDTCGVKVKLQQRNMVALAEAVRDLKSSDKGRLSRFCLLFDDVDLCVKAWKDLGEDAHRGFRAFFEGLSVRCLCVSYQTDGLLGGEAGYSSVLPTIWFSNVLPTEPTRDDINDAKRREPLLPAIDFQSFPELQACLWGYHHAKAEQAGGGHA